MSQSQSANVSFSRVVHGDSSHPAVTVWMNGEGNIYITQNGQDISFEAFCHDSEALNITERMENEIHDLWEYMTDDVTDS